MKTYTSNEMLTLKSISRFLSIQHTKTLKSLIFKRRKKDLNYVKWFQIWKKHPYVSKHVWVGSWSCYLRHSLIFKMSVQCGRTIPLERSGMWGCAIMLPLEVSWQSLLSPIRSEGGRDHVVCDVTHPSMSERGSGSPATVKGETSRKSLRENVTKVVESWLFLYQDMDMIVGQSIRTPIWENSV